jgi:hypothetical protein
MPPYPAVAGGQCRDCAGRSGLLAGRQIWSSPIPSRLNMGSADGVDREILVGHFRPAFNRISPW